MSALCGLYFRRRPFDAELLSKMMKRLEHRGIDGQAQWYNTKVGLGIQKLKITPESLDETLPFFEHQLAIVCHARLDNRDALFQKLKIPPDQHTMSDSTLILLAYRTWGEACVDFFLGDFVVVIWNDQLEKLIIMTDSLGAKSLYYYVDEELFAFSSEIKALTVLPQVPCEPNLKKIAAHRFITSDEKETYFDRIYHVPAASVLSITAHEFRERRYWEPCFTEELILGSEAEYVEAFQMIFENSVRARLRSHYDVACLLSGGLDSSAITHMASKLLHDKAKKLHTYSILKAPSYANLCDDEQIYVDSLSHLPNLVRTDVNSNHYGPFDRMSEFVWHTETPRSGGRSFYFVDILDSMQKKNARVLLDGLYGEAGPSFSGKGYHAQLLLERRVGHLIDEIRARAKLVNKSFLQVFLKEALFPLFGGFHMKLRNDLFYKQSLSAIREDFVESQLGLDLKKRHQKNQRLGRVYPNHHVNQLNVVRYYYEQQKIPLQAMTQGRVQFAHPYLDRSLLTFCLAIPGHMKVKAGYGRYLIRAGMKDALPDKILKRTKGLPFSPDYRFRYNKQRPQLLNFISSLPHHELLTQIVDLDKLKRYMMHEMKVNFGNTRHGFIHMNAVPDVVYLLQFLKTFFIDKAI